MASQIEPSQQPSPPQIRPESAKLPSMLPDPVALNATFVDRLTTPPRDVNRQIIYGLIIIALAFGGLGGWVATAPLDAAVLAPGSLVVQSHRKTIQHLEGGIIKRVLVKDGATVAEGDSLIELDGVRAFANLNLVQSDLDAGIALEARLIAERDNAAEIAFPKDLLQRAGANPGLTDILTTQKHQFIERRRSLNSQIAILNQRMQSTRSEITGLQNEQRSREAQIKIYRDELKGLEELYKKGFFARTRILASQRDIARLEGERGTTLANVARATSAIHEAELQIEQTRQRQREEVAAQLREIQAQIAENRQKVISAQDVTKRLSVVSPVAGVVQGLRVFTAGAVINPGVELMQVVPVSDHLEVDAQLAPHDIEVVRPGMQAEIRFSALKARLIPVITGVVDTVSPDRLTDERSGAPYYMVKVSIPPDQMELLKNHNLIAGMPAELLIRVESRTALSYMLRPLTETLGRGMLER